MNIRSAIQAILLLVTIFVLAACANNLFGRSDRQRPTQGQPQDQSSSDTPLPPVCASAADCGAAQSAISRPLPLTYASQIRKQLETVGKELDLTPRQTVLWDNYMAKLEALITDQSNPDKHLPTLNSAPQQIQRKLDIARDRYTAIEDISEAAIKLYQSLSADQKKTGDQILPSIVPMLYASFGDHSASPKSSSSQDDQSPGIRNSGNGNRRRGGGSTGWGGSGTSY